MNKYFWVAAAMFSLSPLPALGVEQVVRIHAGWNFISLNVVPNEDFLENGRPSIRRIVEQLGEDLIIIRNGAGQFCHPRLGFWGIREWNLQQGYQICVARDCELVVEGDRIPADQPIDLPAGWSSAAYYPTIRYEWGGAFRDLDDRRVFYMVKNGRGQFDGLGHMFGGISTFPGEGLQFGVREPVRFHYPAE